MINGEKHTLLLSAIGPSGREEALTQAAGILRDGGLVAMPTETVYGLGADATNPKAVASIFAAKGRPQDNPLIVHICSLDMLPMVAKNIPDTAYRLAKQFWPGPLTMVLPKTSYIPLETSAGLDTVAIRMPAHPVALELIRRSGVPLAAPSANLSGRPSTTTAQHCIQDLLGRVDAILDGGPCTVGVESTVVSLAQSPPRLLRPGAVTPEALREYLPELVLDPAVVNQPDLKEKVASPGMKYRHYSPKCEVYLLDGPREAFIPWVNRQAEKDSGVFALCVDEDLSALKCGALSLGPKDRPDLQAARLFQCLRELDVRGAQRVYARCPQKEGMDLAIYNRLIRAAAFRVLSITVEGT